VVDKLRQRGAADITFASLSAGFISWLLENSFRQALQGRTRITKEIDNG